MTADSFPPRPPLAATDAPILDQVFDADSLYALRAAVAAHGAQAGLPPGRADDLVIAVHELAANAVRHGAGHGLAAGVASRPCPAVRDQRRRRAAAR